MNEKNSHPIWESFVRFLTPDSLAVARINMNSKTNNKHNWSNIIEVGDLILIRTPGKIYESFRNIAGHQYDHVAAVVNNNMVIHIGPPRIRFLPIDILLVPQREPLVLRPKLSIEERHIFIESMMPLIGKYYDIFRVYALLGRLGVSQLLKLRFPLRKRSEHSVGSDDEVFICTDSIFFRLIWSSNKFAKHIEKYGYPPDVKSLGSWSINDILYLSQPQFNLFDIIPISHKIGKDKLEAQATQLESIQYLLENIKKHAASTKDLNVLTVVNISLKKLMTFPHSIWWIKHLIIIIFLLYIRNTLRKLMAPFHIVNKLLKSTTNILRCASIHGPCKGHLRTSGLIGALILLQSYRNRRSNWFETLKESNSKL